MQFTYAFLKTSRYQNIVKHNGKVAFVGKVNCRKISYQKIYFVVIAYNI